MSAYSLSSYYAGLLIIQYIQKPKAVGTIKAYTPPLSLSQESIETLVFSAVPSSGQFTLVYGEDETSPLLYSATAANVQTALRSLPGLSSVTVSGSFADGFTVYFTGVLPAALLLETGQNTLSNGSSIEVTITAIDDNLPIAVQNGYNLFGDNIAAGNQLDVLGKYVGVLRSGRGFTSQITLGDADFLSLIKVAVIKNSAQSDLATIQQLLFDFFPNQIYVFDFKNMRMSYLISSSVGGQDLVELFIMQGLLPIPMAVQLAVIIYAPIIDAFFGFCDYELPVPLAGQSPFNDWDDYSYVSPWLSYENGIFPS